MKLRDVRKLGIKYCEENNCNYTFISYDKANKFYLTDEEDSYTVFFVNKNGSLDAYLVTKYATDFHREYKKRENNRRNYDKKKLIDIFNYEEDEPEIEMAD